MYTFREMLFYKKLVQQNYQEYLEVYLSLPREIRRELLETFDAGNLSKFLFRLNQEALNMFISDNKFGDTVGLGSFSTLPKYF
jgi:hypothetical protein